MSGEQKMNLDIFIYLQCSSREHCHFNCFFCFVIVAS